MLRKGKKIKTNKYHSKIALISRQKFLHLIANQLFCMQQTGLFFNPSITHKLLMLFSAAPTQNIESVAVSYFYEIQRCAFKLCSKLLLLRTWRWSSGQRVWLGNERFEFDAC